MAKGQKMILLYCNLFLLTFVSIFQQSWQFQALCKDSNVLSRGNQTFEISMVSKRNQTGHWINQLSLEKSSPQIPNNLKVKFRTNIVQIEGGQSFNLLGTIIVPPPRPIDYEFFPNIGYYKFHENSKVTFDEALIKCSMEGGHLAIINSEAEYHVIQTIFSRKFKVGALAFIGFHDRFKEGEYITIFGQSLNDTGYLKWYPGDPNNYGGIQNCGCISLGSFLCDIACEEKLPFFCEFDLSWSDL